MRTVSRLLPKRRSPPSQTWRTFPINHVRDLVSADFFAVPTAPLCVLFVFVVLAHDRRRVLRFKTRSRSLFELRSRYPALPDDGQQRADRQLAVVWNGNRDAAGLGAALHDDMASAPAHFDEPVLLKDPTNFASRQDAKPTHASLRSSLQRLQS